MYLFEPRALRYLELKTEREAQLEAEHIAPLEALSRELENLETRLTGVKTYIPHFDPGDSGIEARILTVLEAPGPMTHGKLRGSGFISVDNDDPTAENTWQLRRDVGALNGVLAWNIVPWYLGTTSIKPKVEELRRGAIALGDLLDRLPRLSTVMLCGRFSQRGWSQFVPQKVQARYRVIETWHPSPLSLSFPGRRAESQAAWAQAIQED